MYLPSFRTLALLFALTPSVLMAQISVTGVSDKSIYDNSATFTVVSQSGFADTVTLNGVPAVAGQPVVVDRPDFYQLAISRTSSGGGPVVETRLVRFIVAASERLGTENGLPAHVPMPVIPSSSSEFEGAHLKLIVPRRFPAGFEIPVVAWVLDDTGGPVRANGVLSDPGGASIGLRRGVGSGFLSSTNPPGVLTYAPAVQGLSATAEVTLEASPAWITLAGELSADANFPENSRVRVTGNVTVPSGRTLRFGAGSVVQLGSRVDITNNGTIRIEGTVLDPVVFMPASRTQPWGGFIMREGTGEIAGSGAVFTGSGADPSWFGANGNPGSHRREQALFYIQNNQRIELTDSAAIFLSGQLGHAVGGGTLRLTRFLMQRTTTGGEFTGASFTVNDSAFIECPADTSSFADGDNDALYLVSGTHAFTNTLFGWTKDDGIDSGGDGLGRLHYEGCWFEATFHEGNSLSGLKFTTAHRTVYYNCGQGLEDGYGAGSGGPTGRVEQCLFVANLSGVRHGDNYVSIGNGYPGNIGAHDSLFLYNHRNVFGFNWRSSGWTNSVGQMFITNNFLTAADPDFPNNAVWNPSVDAWRLGAFGARGRVGAGLALRPAEVDLARLGSGVPVALSSFCTNVVSIDYLVETTAGSRVTGTLQFDPGQVRQFIVLPAFAGVARVSLADPENAELTGLTQVYLQNLPAPSSTMVVPFGSRWKYLDDGSNQGQAWVASAFNDVSWPDGAAELGLGDGDETTLLRRTNPSGANIITYYFRKTITVPDATGVASWQMRLLRDDAGVVYVNGQEVYRSPNLPAAPTPINSTTLATATGEDTIDQATFPVETLIPGTNTIAVEIHQQSATSSDVSFDFELIGLPPAPPVRVEVGRFPDGLVLFWRDGTFSLERADQVTGAAWTPVPGTSPVTVPLTQPLRVFRLRR